MSGVAEVFAGLKPRVVSRYVNYWEKIKPKSREDEWRFWVFSILAANFGWKQNVKAFKAIEDRSRWKSDLGKLQFELFQTKTGLWKTKAIIIWKFDQMFQAKPHLFVRYANEPFTQYRDRIADTVPGLAIAKSSFYMEMKYLGESDVVCLDRRVLKSIHGKDRHVTRSEYLALEDEWRTESRKHGIPAPAARFIWWDNLQGFKTSRYWSEVLE
jgi:thermostable 8-oxoguanine DNA glycosylase